MTFAESSHDSVTIFAAPPRALEVDARQTTQASSPQFIGPLRCPAALTVKQVSILRHLAPALNPDFLRNIVVPVITQKNRVSLRALDWAVVQYCRRYGVMIEHNHQIVNIHEVYSKALTHWRRRNFDPFRRRCRLYFTLDKVEYESTCGQLCFLVWSVRMGIFDFVVNNIADIEADMYKTNAAHRAAKKGGEKRHKNLHDGNVRCLIRPTHTSHFE